MIPTAARGQHLERCLTSIRQRSDYAHLELVIVDSSGGRLEGIDELADAVVVPYDGPFNYSKAINSGARHATGEYVVLLNDDVEVLAPDWIKRLLEQAMKPGVGIVGAKLLYRDGTIQHGGVLIQGRIPEHLFQHFPNHPERYAGLLAMTRDCSAVTGACMMVDRVLFDWLGGLDESYVLDFGDVDFCLRALAHGERIVWTPHVVLRHDERSSRGARSPVADLETFRKHWGAFVEAGDPFYDPSLSTTTQFEPLAS